MPRKPRILQGHELPNNLYQHPRKTPDRWRYKQPDGSWYYFDAPIEAAIEAAKQLNTQHNLGTKLGKKAPIKPGRLSFARHTEEFIEEREKRDPSLTKKESWRTRRTYLRQLARHFAGTNINKVTLLDIQEYWDEFSGHAQRGRRAEFKRFFNHLFARELCTALPSNPFSNDDSKPQVAMRAKEAKQRLRLSVGQFWTIYSQAGDMGLDFLQVAMGISLITTMRRGDICDLRLDQHVAGNLLRKQINKSHAQLSEAEFKADPSNLSWNLDKHTLLRKVVNRARELSLVHARCPYLVSFKPQRRIKGSKRKHTHQVLPDYLTRAFTEARDATNLFKQIPEKAKPTFHEIRALSGHLYKKAEYTTKDVQVLMAHTDEKITKHYQAGHETHWTEIELILPEQVIAGEF